MVNQTNVADFDKDEKFDEPGFVEASPTTHKMTPAEIADAQRAALAGAQMSFGEAFSKYKKGLFWSMTVSCAIIMESYDTMLVTTFFSYPTFVQKFGDRLPNGTYSIPANWQTALGLASTLGIIIGIFANGFLLDRFGHKRVLLASIAVLTGLIGMTFAASSRGMLFASQLLCGLPWGTINSLAPSYAIETAPIALRHYASMFVNLCWVIGHLIGAGVLNGLVSNKTEWGWRIPFALQWMFPVPIFIACYFCPDSPWWLVRKGRTADAVKALDRLSDGSMDNTAVATLIEHTVNLEKELNFGASYADCFKGVDRRRTEIATVVWCAQSLVGFVMQSYSTYFFLQAGVAATDAFKLTLGQFAIAFVGTSLAMPLQARFNRVTIWFAGLTWMAVAMGLVAIFACLEQTTAMKWAQSVTLLLWFFGYGWSVGPLPFVICAEVGSAQLRQKTISIARDTYYCLVVINSVAGPYLFNPTAANLKGKAAFLPFSFILALIVWSYFRLPETKGRSFEDLDIMFAKKVKARDFKSYKVTDEARAAGHL